MSQIGKKVRITERPVPQTIPQRITVTPNADPNPDPDRIAVPDWPVSVPIPVEMPMVPQKAVVR